MKGKAETNRGTDHHPDGTDTHLVNEPRAAHEAEPTERAGKNGNAGHHDPQAVARHEEVARALRSPHRPEAHGDAGQHVTGHTDENNGVAVFLHGSGWVCRLYLIAETAGLLLRCTAG